MMNNTRVPLIMILLLIISAMTVHAQVEETPEAEHLAVAHELLIAMESEKAHTEGIETMVELQIQQNPAIEQLGPAMRRFFRKYAGWDRLKDFFAEIYATEFTESELRDLVTFYSTDLGKKVARLTPGIQKKAAAFGADLVQKHQSDLQRMLMEEMETPEDSNSDSESPY